MFLLKQQSYWIQRQFCLGDWFRYNSQGGFEEQLCRFEDWYLASLNFYMSCLMQSFSKPVIRSHNFWLLNNVGFWISYKYIFFQHLPAYHIFIFWHFQISTCEEITNLSNQCTHLNNKYLVINHVKILYRTWKKKERDQETQWA